MSELLNTSTHPNQQVLPNNGMNDMPSQDTINESEFEIIMAAAVAAAGANARLMDALDPMLTLEPETVAGIRGNTTYCMMRIANLKAVDRRDAAQIHAQNELIREFNCPEHVLCSCLESQGGCWLCRMWDGCYGPNLDSRFNSDQDLSDLVSCSEKESPPLAETGSHKRITSSFLAGLDTAGNSSPVTSEVTEAQYRQFLATMLGRLSDASLRLAAVPVKAEVAVGGAESCAAAGPVVNKPKTAEEMATWARLLSAKLTSMIESDAEVTGDKFGKIIWMLQAVREVSESVAFGL